MTDHITHTRLLKLEARIKVLEQECGIEPEGEAAADDGEDLGDDEPAKPATRSAAKGKRRR